MPPACTEVPRSSLRSGMVLPRRPPPLLCQRPRRLRRSPTPRHSCPGCPLPAHCGGVRGRLRRLHSLTTLPRRRLLTWQCGPSLGWWTPSAAARWWQVRMLSRLVLMLLDCKAVCRHHLVAAGHPEQPACPDASCSWGLRLQQPGAGRSACAACFSRCRPLCATSDCMLASAQGLAAGQVGRQRPAADHSQAKVRSEIALLFLQLGTGRGLS